MIFDKVRGVLRGLGTQYQLLVLRFPLQMTFPRIYDLYTHSHRNNPDNYFEHPNCIGAVKRREEKLVKLLTQVSVETG